MAAPRLRRVSSRKEMENLIDDYVTQGYAILEQSEKNAMVQKKSWGTSGGHILWALVNSLVDRGYWKFDLCNYSKVSS